MLSSCFRSYLQAITQTGPLRCFANWTEDRTLACFLLTRELGIRTLPRTLFLHLCPCALPSQGPDWRSTAYSSQCIQGVHLLPAERFSTSGSPRHPLVNADSWALPERVSLFLGWSLSHLGLWLPGDLQNTLRHSSETQDPGHWLLCCVINSEHLPSCSFFFYSFCTLLSLQILNFSDIIST